MAGIGGPLAASFTVCLDWLCQGLFNAPAHSQTSQDHALAHPHQSTPFTDAVAFVQKVQIPICQSGLVRSLPEREDHFWRPAAIDSLGELCGAQAKSMGPFVGTLGLTSKGQYLIASGIARLILASCPTAIVARVTKFIVDTLDAVHGWTWPHVREELLETPVPFRGHADASAPIIGVRLGRCVVTAALDFCPRPVFTCIGKSVGSMLAIGNRSVTPTPKAQSSDEILSIHVLDRATYTAATIPKAVLQLFRFPQDCPSAKYSTGFDEQFPNSHMTNHSVECA